MRHSTCYQRLKQPDMMMRSVLILLSFLMLLIHTSSVHADISVPELLEKHGKTALIKYIRNARNGEITIQRGADDEPYNYSGPPGKSVVNANTITLDLAHIKITPAEVDKQLSQKSEQDASSKTQAWKQANNNWKAAVYQRFAVEFRQRCRDKGHYKDYCDCKLHTIYQQASGTDLEKLKSYSHYVDQLILFSQQSLDDSDPMPRPAAPKDSNSSQALLRKIDIMVSQACGQRANPAVPPRPNINIEGLKPYNSSILE